MVADRAGHRPHIFFLACAVNYGLHIEGSLFLVKQRDASGSIA